MLHSINLNFSGITVKVETPVEGFISFLKMYFAENEIKGEPEEESLLISFEISDEQDFQNKDKIITESKAQRQLSRSIFISDNTVLLDDLQLFPGLKLIYAFDHGNIAVNGYYHKKSSWRSFITDILYKGNRETRLYLYLKYYLVLFPVIFYYEHFRYKYLLHASAVLYKDKPVLFPGLGGAGKSTLVVSLLENSDFALISDNLVLYGNDEIIGINEAIALDQNSIQQCKKSLSSLIPLQVQMSHNRQYFRINNPVPVAKNPEKLFFISFGEKSGIELINREAGFEKLQLINAVAREVAEYRSVASAVNLASDFLVFRPQTDMLKQLINKTQQYELTIRKFDSMKNIQNILLEVINEK